MNSRILIKITRYFYTPKIQSQKLVKLKFVDNKQRKKKVSKINENCSIRRFVFALVGSQLKTKSWI